MRHNLRTCFASRHKVSRHRSFLEGFSHAKNILAVDVCVYCPYRLCRRYSETAAGKRTAADEDLESKGTARRNAETSVGRIALSDQQNKGDWVKFEPMSDEFEGDRLDLNKWTLGGEVWQGRQPAKFSDRNVTVSDGKLNLTMRKEKLTAEDAKHGFHDYTSASLYSKARSSYGYYEVLAKPMDSAGSSAFWFQRETRYFGATLAGICNFDELRYQKRKEVAPRHASRRHRQSTALRKRSKTRVLFRENVERSTVGIYVGVTEHGNVETENEVYLLRRLRLRHAILVAAIIIRGRWPIIRPAKSR